MKLFTSVGSDEIEVLNVSSRHDCRPLPLAVVGFPKWPFAWGDQDDPGLYETGAAIIEAVGGRAVARRWALAFTDEVVRKLPEQWSLWEWELDSWLTVKIQEVIRECEGK